MTVTLKPDLEEELNARAEGLSIEDFVDRELEGLAKSEQPSHPNSTPELRAHEWERLLGELAVGGPPLSNYAVSRESIYGERDDKQL